MSGSRYSLVAWPPGSAALLFAVHTTSAAVVSLVLAAACGLPHPWWAAMTVWLVAQPTRGLFVERCIARLLGTCVGAVAGGLLLMAFAGSRAELLLALAAWIMVCAGVASTLRHFRSYAALLAGYTASVVGLFALAEGDPDFTQAFARIAATVIGIVVSATSSYFFSARGDGGSLQHSVACMVNRCANWCAFPVEGRKSAWGLVEQKALIVAAGALERSLEDLAAGSLSARRRAGSLRHDLWQAMADMAAAGVAASPFDRIGTGRLVRTGTLAAEAWPDWGHIAGAAFRAATALALAGTAWLLTDWEHAPVMIMTAAIFSSLFSSHAHASQALHAVMLGTLSGAALGLLCRTFLLPAAGSYTVAVLMLIPFLALGAVLMVQPRTAKMAIDLNMAFLLVAQPALPMPAPGKAAVTQAAATLCGIGFAWLSMRLCPVAGPVREERRQAARMRRLAAALIVERSPYRRARYRQTMLETGISLAIDDISGTIAAPALACVGWAVQLERRRIEAAGAGQAHDTAACAEKLKHVAEHLYTLVLTQRRSK